MCPRRNPPRVLVQEHNAPGALSTNHRNGITTVIDVPRPGALSAAVLVGAGARDERHLRARRAAELAGVGRGLELECLQRSQRDQARAAKFWTIWARRGPLP